MYDLIELIIETTLWTKDYSTFDTHTQHTRLLFNEYLFHLCDCTCSNVMCILNWNIKNDISQNEISKISSIDLKKRCKDKKWSNVINCKEAKWKASKICNNFLVGCYICSNIYDQTIWIFYFLCGFGIFTHIKLKHKSKIKTKQCI